MLDATLGTWDTSIKKDPCPPRVTFRKVISAMKKEKAGLTKVNN